MAFLGALGPAREAARRSFFELLRQTFATDDGRRLLADSLNGLTRTGAIPRTDVDMRQYYPDLQTPRRPSLAAPVFITARFRTGSTLLWNVFRQVPQCTAFYEPLNERRWFDAHQRGSRVDATHVGVHDYWREYEGLEELGRYYSEDWIRRRLYMDSGDSDAALEAYINALITAAPGTAVLQFNRVDFRLPWLRRRFPEARIIHLHRHPRDQWISTLVNPSSVPPDVTIEQFIAHDHYYLLMWATDLAYHFPFLDPRRVSHPYELFYYIWRLSMAFGVAYADASIGFHQLCDSPDTTVPGLMQAAGIADYPQDKVRAVIDPAGARPRWLHYASQQWFEEHEGRCEEVLARELQSWSPQRPASYPMPAMA